MLIELREQISRLINGGGATNGQILAYNSTTKRFEVASTSNTLFTQQSGTPIGSLLPTSVGDRCHDTDTNAIYTAIGLTNTDWIVG